jgi:thymidine phosphorylase
VNGAEEKSDDAETRLKARRLWLESQQQPIVLMHKDCPICRSEGFTARTRVQLRHGDRTALATLYQVGDNILSPDEAGLSESAWSKLAVEEGGEITAVHPRPLASMSSVRAKLYGRRLGDAEFREIIGDIVAERYSDVELAAFVAAFASRPCALTETVALTRAMVGAGEQLSWPSAVVADKHSVGGLPGNRTTPILVAIVAAAGLTIPKTSSRAITSPAGTADVMETMTNVDLDAALMREVVEREGGCLAWGGSVRLSPADDIIIRVERELDVDCDTQLIASVLSKKIAAGATHVLLDIPVGPTAKVRTEEEARALSQHLVAVGKRFGLSVLPSISDGAEPVGRRIGPALEAHDVLAVLRGTEGAPEDLRQRALTLAAKLLAFAGGMSAPEAAAGAERILVSGAALRKFMAICAAQGGFREPPVAPLTDTVSSPKHGVVSLLDNRLLGRTAKLAGAPRAASAGLEMHVKLRQPVARGTPLFTLHAESEGELAYARAFVDRNPDIVTIAPL